MRWLSRTIIIKTTISSSHLIHPDECSKEQRITRTRHRTPLTSMPCIHVLLSVTVPYARSRTRIFEQSLTRTERHRISRNMLNVSIKLRCRRRLIPNRQTCSKECLQISDTRLRGRSDVHLGFQPAPRRVSGVLILRTRRSVS